jgi:hypothetical protein
MKVDAFFISELEKKLLKIDNGSLPRNDKLGKIGEKFVKEGIKYYFWEKGFCVGKVGNETFNIGGPYKPVAGGMGGIDFRLEFRYNGTSFDCYIEVKNWSPQKISKKKFDTEIKGRFTKNAPQSGCKWIITMNKRNVPLIQKRCLQNNISIIPLEEHITSGYLIAFQLISIMDHFLDEFSNLIDTMVGIPLQNSTKKVGKTIPEQIQEDIRLGKPYSLITLTYNKSASNIQKIKNQMKKKGVVLIDRNKKEWDTIQFKTR